jgi:lysophospholipase L1-like esterase
MKPIPISGRRMRRSMVAAACAVPLVLATGSVLGPASASGPIAPAEDNAWIGTWAMAPSGKVDNGCRDCTIRDVIHTSIGGRMVRVHLSNVFGTAPLVIGDASVALPQTPDTAQVAPGTLRPLTFAGQRQVTIPTGQSVISDPVQEEVPAGQDLLVTTFTPGYATPMTFHPDAQEDSYFTTGPDQADATSASALPQRTQAWHFVTGVDVAGTSARGTVVAFGDSITDGYRSAYDVDHRWPDYLAGRLLQQPPGQQLGVLNTGIGGNRILLDGGDGFGPAALTRFQRDVIDQTGVRDVIVLEGINDIQQTPHQLDPTKIIAGLQQLADQAHAAGIRVLGGTITPFEGWQTYDAQEEATRQAVNTWIRSSGAFDAVIDFDAAVRDPADLHRMLPLYDSGDHLHPNDIGYATMGNAVDLAQL